MSEGAKHRAGPLFQSGKPSLQHLILYTDDVDSRREQKISAFYLAVLCGFFIRQIFYADSLLQKTHQQQHNRFERIDQQQQTVTTTNNKHPTTSITTTTIAAIATTETKQKQQQHQQQQQQQQQQTQQSIM